MNKLLGFFSVAIFVCTCGQAAPMQLLKSTPADGTVTDKSPSAFVLEFSERVKLHDLYVRRDGEKRATPVSNLPYAEAAAFTIAAPSLTSGGYVLEWRVFTHDFKALTGRVRFTVAGEQMATTSSSTH